MFIRVSQHSYYAEVLVYAIWLELDIPTRSTHSIHHAIDLGITGTGVLTNSLPAHLPPKDWVPVFRYYR